MSDLNQFRSKGPELLVELAQHTSETVREIIDIEPAVADQIGQAVANRMMQVWGGQNVYFPMGMVWKVSQRDRKSSWSLTGATITNWPVNLVFRYSGFTAW
jgi:Mor family transcriptional regulator